MKKVFFYLLFALFTLSATQSAFAQSKPEEIAKQTVAELSQKLNLTGEQQRALFRPFVIKEADYAKQVAGKDLSDAEVAAAKKNIDEALDKGVKAVLTAEQYAEYKKSGN